MGFCVHGGIRGQDSGCSWVIFSFVSYFSNEFHSGLEKELGIARYPGWVVDLIWGQV
jgi:hypothetical protein